MKQTGPDNFEHVAGMVVSLLGVVGIIIFAAFYRSAFSVVWAVCAVVLMLAAFLRSRKLRNREAIQRLDEAISPKDSEKSDPRAMARWIP